MADAHDSPVFHYRDAAGRDVLTNDPHGLPADAEIVDTSAPAAARHAGVAVPARSSAVPHVDTFSAVVGGAAGLVVGFAVATAIVRRTEIASPGRRFFMRAGVAIAAVVVVGALYLGLVLRGAGLGDAVVATPDDAIEQAQQAAAAANRATRAQARALEQATRD